MSYTIVYGRQFIRTTRGILPLVLCGSNNCTQLSVSGREVRERGWNIFYNSDMVELPDEDFMKYVRNLHDESDRECFKFNGKWIDGKDAIRFFENGVKAALPIEDVVERIPHQRLICYLSIWDNGASIRHRTELKQYGIRTTPELELWIDEAKARKRELTDYSVYICIEYDGQEPLRLGVGADPEGQVIAKSRRGYICDFEKEKSISMSNDILEAIIFKSAGEAREKLGNFTNIRLIKASNQRPRAFAIRVVGGTQSGYYVKQKTKTHLRLSMNHESARHFGSKSEAERYIKTMLEGRYPTAKVFEVVEKQPA